MNNFPCSTKRELEEKKCTSSEQCWIEKPKYFSGQLLTDADLRAELNYVIEKNKLHNRYLHGWGVVCGLKVKCYPCCSGHGSSGRVVVEPGYAIDCCGNDIVVCNDQEFDLIKRISEIKKKKQAESDPCAPAATPISAPCADKEEKYYLTIAYKEEDAKPVTAFKAKDGCSIQRCVPSRTRECFELDIRECDEFCPKHGIEFQDSVANFEESLRREDNLLKRGWKCIELLKKNWPKNDQGNPKKWQELTPQEIKNCIEAYYKAVPDNVHCNLLGELEGIEISSNSEQALKQLGALLAYEVFDCLCSALINPCPICSENDLVILACITVKDNKIKDICNLSRKWVITFPTLFYWFPINEITKWLTQFLCCEIDWERLWPVFEGLVSVAVKPEVFKAAAGNLKASSNTVSKSLFATIDPENVSLRSALYKKSDESKVVLEKLNIEVVTTKRHIPSPKDFGLDHIISTIPYARPGSKVIQLVDEEDNVVGIKILKKEEKVPEVEVADLRREMDEIKANISIMKSHMRRDAGSIIKTKLAIKEDYRPLAIELTRGLAKEMPPEVLKDVEDVRAGKMRKAKINSVLNVLEAVPADVSDAVKEPMANALKYVDNAENLTLDVASYVAGELEKVKITKKEDLDKLDTKKIATKCKISERKVKKVIEKIQASR